MKKLIRRIICAVRGGHVAGETMTEFVCVMHHENGETSEVDLRVSFCKLCDQLVVTKKGGAA